MNEGGFIMSQSYEHLNDIIPGVTGEEFVALRNVTHEIIANNGGCESTEPLYNSHDDADFEGGMADGMEDMFSAMSEHAANKDEDGYHLATEICSTIHEIRQLKKLSETVRWFKIKPSRFAEKSIMAVALWVNPKLGNTINAARLFSSENVFHLNSYVTAWNRNKLRDYEWFKRIVRIEYNAGRPYKQFFNDFRTLRDSCLFMSDDFVGVPFICDAIGFDQPQRLYEQYFLRGITFENDELMFECENFEQFIDERNGGSLFSHRIHFKDESLRCPRLITVPADAIVYNISKKWKDYVHSTIA
jgi:hypothetical protein